MNLFYLFTLLILLNVRTYVLMIWDKWKSKQKNEWRISEKQLLLSGLLFGSLGIILGMFPPVNHKKRKPRFRYFMPLIACIQIFIAYKSYNWAFFSLNLYWKLPF